MKFSDQPIIPYQPCNIPTEIQLEFARRSSNRNFNYVKDVNGEWDDSIGEWTKYKGSMVPWVRFTSNGQGYETGPDINKPGFIFFGGKDFYSDYGFGKQGESTNSSIIGYQADAKMTPHTIDNSKDENYPVHVPVPEIERISVSIQKGLYRKATIEWTCFSKKQLEYMTPYFLVPGISCILEYGWNNYNPSYLLDVSNTNNLIELDKNPFPLYTDHILKSNGNYDVTLGVISEFEWSLDGNKIKCKTVILSKDRLYSGLATTATVEGLPSEYTDDKKIEDTSKLPIGSLIKFIDEDIANIKSITDKSSDLSLNIVKAEVSAGGMKTSYNYILNDTNNALTFFVKYLIQTRPKTWKKYLYGIFYGRDISNVDTLGTTYKNATDDFDFKDQSNLWLNMGLVIDILNYHAAQLKIGTTSNEIFRVDIDDIKINAHKNMISTNGKVLLIPNKVAPKYFNGGGYFDMSNEDIQLLKNSSIKIQTNSASPADLRLKHVCQQPNMVYRDDLNELINGIRTNNGIEGDFAFPIEDVNTKSKSFTRGYLKDLYIHVDFLKLIAHDQEVKTYADFIQKLLDGITAACGNFWDLRLVAATGDPTTVSNNQQACMKIVDYNYVDDIGTPYTFNYMTNDSILLGLDFKPTISDAQACRALYSSTSNSKNSKSKLNNGTNLLLDYVFRDRLKTTPPDTTQNNSGTTTSQGPQSAIEDILKTLQSIKPTDAPNSPYQMTTFKKTYILNKGRQHLQQGDVIIRRLVLPSQELLNLLLDDFDYEENKSYVGIMPGIQASFTMQGIGGLRTFMMFFVDGLPFPYSMDDVVFRITDTNESLDGGKWITTITAGIIPLRNNIRRQLGLPVKT